MSEDQPVVPGPHDPGASEPINPWTPPGPPATGESMASMPGSSAASPVDKVSVTAFVFSLIGFGIVAIPLAIWGLVRTKPGPRRGRGFAVAALAISVAWVVVGSALLLTLGVFAGGQKAAVSDVSDAIPTATATAPTTSANATTSAGAPVAPQPTGPLSKAKRVYWEDLRQTMCVRIPEAPDAIYVSVLDCRAEHEEEVTARTVLAGTTKWPGDDAVDTAAEDKCRTAFEAYVGIGYDDSRFELDFLTTDKSGWEEGDRRLICLVLDPSQQKLTRSLRGAGQ
jgi:hypothetical protein